MKNGHALLKVSVAFALAFQFFQGFSLAQNTTASSEVSGRQVSRSAGAAAITVAPEAGLEAISAFGDFFNGKAELLSRGNDKPMRALAIAKDDMKPWDILAVGDFLIFNPDRADEAAAHLKEVIRLHQNSTYAVALATFDLSLNQAFGLGDFKGAATKLSAIDDFPVNAVQDYAIFFRALFQILSEDVSGGVATFEKVAKKTSSSSVSAWSSGIFDDSRYLKGIFRAWLLGDPRGACDDFKRLISDYPGSPLGTLAISELARTAFASGDIVLAESLLSRMAATGGGSDSESLLATLHTGDPEEMEKRADLMAARKKAAVKSMVDDFRALVTGLGKKGSDPVAAVADFTRRHADSPLVPMGAFLLGARLAGEGKLDLSNRILAEIESSWQGFPCSDMASYRAVWASTELKGYARFTALESLKAKAPYLPYAPFLAMDEVLELFLNANQPEATIPYAEAMGTAGPEFKHMEQFMLGILALRKGDFERAIKLMETNVELYFLSPYTDDSLFLRGEILGTGKVPGMSRREATKEAARVLGRLMGEYPRSPYAQRARELMESMSPSTGR